MIQFTVAGQPVGKARARVTMVGGFARAYTPAKTRKYEDAVKLSALMAMRNAGQVVTERPVEVMIEMRVQIPASWSKARRLAASMGQIRATNKPDIDNLAKGIADACNGVCWADDSQIVLLTVRKLYAAEPCVIVAVRVVEGEAA